MSIVSPSWIPSANQPGTDFPLANLPFGAFAVGGETHLGLAIGDLIFDLHAAAESGLLAPLSPELRAACAASSLNPLLALGALPSVAVRRHVRQWLSDGECAAAGQRDKISMCLVPQLGAVMRLPMVVGDYTDFYASIHHATNVGSVFRPDQPLLPNYKNLPVGYHGRSSSLVVSETAIRRPNGQRPATGGEGAPPDFGPSRQLDYEAEIGLVMGTGNALGEPVRLASAEAHMFGICLLNDWSARDLQRWEYQPLGPFLGKNFATSLSPWIVTVEALAPYRAPAAARGPGDPALLPYLQQDRDRLLGGLDMTVEVYLSSRSMREHSLEAVRLSQSRVADLYWTLAQLVAHHTSNGCNLRPGDLLGSGTLSGAAKSARGCLLELTSGLPGKVPEPLVLPTGETRRFLEDGDEVVMRAYCQREGSGRIGWGECRGQILPASL